MSRKYRTLACASAFAMMSSLACAADLPIPPEVAPVPPVETLPTFSWTGLYLGAWGGHHWGENDIAVFTPGGGLAPVPAGDSNPDSYDIDGWSAGGFLGANYQWNWVVLGVEGDAEWTNIEGRLNSAAVAGAFAETEIEWQGSVRGRIGAAFGQFMLYGTGGVAFAGIEDRFSDGAATNESDSDVEVGWTAGVGAELALSANTIFLRGEYRYTDYGERDHTFTTGALTGFTAEQETDIHSIRFGLGYLF